MKLQTVLEKLEETFLPEYAVSWDNSGLILGDRSLEVQKVFLALDASEPVIRQAKEAGTQLIVTHHPMLFSPVKKINSDNGTGRKILALAEAHMACYAMHTNFDILAMADYLAALLGLEDTRVLEPAGPSGSGKEDGPARRQEGFGRYGVFAGPLTVEQCARLVKERLKLPYVLVSGPLERRVQVAAVSSGSGKSMTAPALAVGADVLITGDMDHHTVLDAAEEGLAVIDAGHYGTEYIFMEYMKRWFAENLPELETETANVKPPFTLL